MGVDVGGQHRRNILQELGFAVRLADGEIRGSARVTPHMHVPGTGRLRTSILAAWADYLAGRLAVEVMAPRVPVTLDLDVHLYRPAPGSGTVTGVGRTVKAGRSVFVAGIEFVSEDGEPVATAAGSFMYAPDPSIVMPSLPRPEGPPPGPFLAMPFAERAGCARSEPGVAVLRRSEEGLNASGTVSGGLIALAMEEAVLSLAPGGTLCSLGLRYLQAVRVGPAVATADLRHGLGRADLRDTGGGDRLCVTATARVFPAGAAPSRTAP